MLALKKEADVVLRNYCLSFTDIKWHVEAFNRFEYNVGGDCYGIPDGKRGKFRPSSDAFKSERKYHILEAMHRINLIVNSNSDTEQWMRDNCSILDP